MSRTEKSISNFWLSLPKGRTPRWIVMGLDIFVSIIALFLAYLMRFEVYKNELVIRQEFEVLKSSFLIIIALKLFAFYLFKIHKGIIRYTSFVDVRRLFYAVLTSSVFLMAVGLLRYFFFDGKYLIPMSVLFVEFLTSLLLLVGYRLLIKMYYIETIKRPIERRKNVVIYGAGVSGLITKRTIEKDPTLTYVIVGFLDDNIKLSKTRLEGVTVFHTSSFEKLIRDNEVDLLVLAMQQSERKNTSPIIDICLNENIEVQSVPKFQSWINGEFTTKQLRKVNIDDLLGRKPIVLDEEMIKQQLQGKRILVTGAAGSIGSGIVRQLVAFSPKQVILLDQAESALYDFHNELIAADMAENTTVVIGDVRNRCRMSRLFKAYKPELVFHAAAYKHVPLMEDNPSEAINTNIAGTKNLVDLSDEFSVEKFVMVSTDKAVNPTNVMGASKRIAEIYAQIKNCHSETQFVTTRFGNVLGSNGSVIPLFKKQIEQGGPITVTDEHITRYFMTIPEACQLVLEAGTMGEGGEIFVFDMGESVKIVDLAKKMIRLSGLELGKDIDIKFTGLRPGEKLYEELLANDENTLPTHHPQILIAKNKPSEEVLIQKIDSLIQLFDKQNNDEMVRLMKEIVPEFISNNSIFTKLDQ